MTWGARRQIIRVNNVSGEEIPPFAAMELSYSAGSCLIVSDDETYWNVKKPTSAAVTDTTKIVFNGPSHIAIGGTGEAVIDAVGIALLSDTGSVLSVGASVGPVASSWYLASTGSGWNLKTRDYTSPAFAVSSDIKSVYVERTPGKGNVWIKFTLTGALTATGSATITTTSDSTNWPTTTAITVTNYSGKTALTGAIGTAILIGTTWFVVEVSRPAALVQAVVSCNSHDWTSGDSARGFTADATTPITHSSMSALGTYPCDALHPSVVLTNTFNFPFLNGDAVVAAYVDDDTYDIIEVKRQKCLRFRFVLTADAPTGLTPNLTATAICPIANDSGPPPSGSLTLKDIYGVAHNAKSGHKGVACYDFNNNWYFVEQCQHYSTRFIGTLQATLSGSAATISVTPVSALNGILPSGTQTVKNTYSWADGTTGHKIAVEWNPDLGQWETYQMRCPS